MDDMELDETPAQQSEDPFKGDPAVAVEQPAQAEALAEQPATENVQPEAVAEEKPKWQKIVGTVSTILIAVTGVLAALFLCLMSLKAVAPMADKTLMLKDIANNITDYSKALTEAGESASMEILADIMSGILYNAYILWAMVFGLVTGIVCGIILIVKSIKQFAMKKETTLEKTAITTVLFLFAVSVFTLSMGADMTKVGGLKAGVVYGPATMAGLIICGILFAGYFICKIIANYQIYKNDKVKLINGCFNLGWALVAMLVLALLSCAPVILTTNGASIEKGFSAVFSESFAQILKKADTATDEALQSLAKQYMFSAVGMVIQIWLIFQSGKSLHGAMRGTASGEKTVKLGSQIWRLVLSVLYLIMCVVVAKELAVDSELKVSLAVPVVILVFSVIGLVLAIVNKCMVKEKADKKEI